MTAGPSFTHRGVAINLETHSGKWFATINGKMVRAPSLDAMKKRIDKAQKFETFTALRDVSYKDDKHVKKSAADLIRVTVGGATRGDGVRDGYRFALVGDGAIDVPYHELYEDTPENIAAILEYRRLRDEFDALKREWESRVRAAKKKIRVLRADRAAAFSGKPPADESSPY